MLKMGIKLYFLYTLATESLERDENHTTRDDQIRLEKVSVRQILASYTAGINCSRATTFRGLNSVLVRLLLVIPPS